MRSSSTRRWLSRGVPQQQFAVAREGDEADVEIIEIRPLA